jgi:subtilisin-like proprotein convertase family protein
MLVGPGGQKAILMSDAGGGTDIQNVTLIFDDNAPGSITSAANINSGIYRPGNLTTTSDNFPAPAPAATLESSLSVFNGTNPNGVWSLYVLDDATGDIGAIEGGWCLHIETAPMPHVCNSGQVFIPDLGTSGPAAPYPSTLTVTGVSNITKLRVELRDIAHTFPSDMDIMLVAPGGQKAILMSDVGGGTDVENITILFDDNASSPIPSSGALISGVFRPGNLNVTNDNFPVPAPAATLESSLSVFNGTSPNGVWSLYVLDDATGDTGIIAGGWCLHIETVPKPDVCNSSQVLLPDAGTSGVGAPYPSTLTVSGVSTIGKLTVEVRDINHTFPSDIDLMLVGPAGQNVMLMSDAGGGTDALDATLVFDDDAATSITTITALTSGTFQPGNDNLTSDNFPASAPAPSGGSSLSVFTGTNPNGVWSLYAVDDATGDIGAISGGWCLHIQEAASPSITCPPNDTVPNSQGICGTLADYTGALAPLVAGTPVPTITFSPTAGSLLPVGTTSVTATATNAFGSAQCSFNVTVADTELPQISVSLSPAVLWPPNQMMRTITATVSATDNCATANWVLTSVTGDDGTTVSDINAVTGSASTTFNVRAKRSGQGNGRTYTATFTSTDGSGNIQTATGTVFVPLKLNGAKMAPENWEDAGTDVIFLYPNPADKTLQLKLPAYEGTAKLRILNSLGQVSSETIISTPTLTLDVSGLAAGLYYVQFESNIMMTTQKFMKQ